MSAPSPGRPALAAVLAALLLGAGASAVASPGGSRGADLRDPVYVFYRAGDCPGEALELEVWDREARAWRPHSRHPRVPVESCQLEDAGVLLNELRWRCADEPREDPSAGWVTGLDVFDPEVMQRCAVERVLGEEGSDAIVVTAPDPDRPVRNATGRVRLEGRVLLDGLPAADWDVVVALDVSDRTREGGADLLAAQVEAARAFARRLAPRLGAVRLGLVTYPDLRPEPGSPGGTGARREASLGADYAAFARALRAVERRGAAGFESFSSGLAFAVDELLGRTPGSRAREDARKALLIAADGRHGTPFGPEAASAPGLRRAVLAAAAEAHEAGVALHWFAVGGLAGEPGPLVRDALRRGSGSFRRVLEPDAAGAFFDAVSLPVLEEVRVTDLRARDRVEAVELLPGGRFAAPLALEGGRNPVLITAVTSDGRERSRRLVLRFDDSLVRQELLAEERERMRRAREAGEGRVEVEPERPVGRPDAAP